MASRSDESIEFEYHVSDAELFEQSTQQFSSTTPRQDGRCLTPPPREVTIDTEVEASISAMSLLGRPPRSPSPVMRRERDDEHLAWERATPLRQKLYGTPLRCMLEGRLSEEQEQDDDSAKRTFMPQVEEAETPNTDIHHRREDDARRALQFDDDDDDDDDDTGSDDVTATEEAAAAADEWREARDARTGDAYFYNRRTRRSAWDLPFGAVTVNARDGRRIYAPRDESRAQTAPARRQKEEPVPVVVEEDKEQRPWTAPSNFEQRGRTLKPPDLPTQPAVVATPTKPATKPAVVATPPRSAARALAAVAQRVSRTPLHSANTPPPQKEDKPGKARSLAQLKQRVNSNARRARTAPAQTTTLATKHLNRESFDEDKPAQPRVFCAYCGEKLFAAQLHEHLSDCVLRERLASTAVETELQKALRRTWGDSSFSTSTTTGAASRGPNSARKKQHHQQQQPPQLHSKTATTRRPATAVPVTPFR